jgi:hypothetical protein
MTHDELIRRAIEQLKENKVTSAMLESPHVRDAAVVYFKIRPDSNCMLVLDSQTGEKIVGYFSNEPFIPEYMSHCRTSQPVTGAKAA